MQARKVSRPIEMLLKNFSVLKKIKFKNDLSFPFFVVKNAIPTYYFPFSGFCIIEYILLCQLC